MDFTSVGSATIRNSIYCRESSDEEIERHFQDAEKSVKHEYLVMHGHDVNFPFWWTFVIEQDNTVYLKSITFFSPQHCAQIKLVEINILSTKTSNWTTENFFSVDSLDFHGCELVFGFIRVYSVFPRLALRLIQKSLNFSFALNSMSDSSTRDFRDNSLKIVELLFANNVDHSSFYESHMSAPISSNYLLLTIPYAQPLTAFEKMFFPFDNYVWILFTASFLVAYFLILIINRFGDIKTAKLIYGDSVKSPALNVYAIFMGVGMTVLPKKNFPRFLLMSFILFCLIMR